MKMKTSLFLLFVALTGGVVGEGAGQEVRGSAKNDEEACIEKAKHQYQSAADHLDSFAESKKNPNGVRTSSGDIPNPIILPPIILPKDVIEQLIHRMDCMFPPMR